MAASTSCFGALPGAVADSPASLSGVAAGWPIFGQFVAYDITADRSALRSHVDPAALSNARAPQLNVECLYGDGPIGHPFLFQRDDPAKLLLGADEVRGSGAPAPAVFDLAALELRWHYQWAVLDEFLHSLVGRAPVDKILSEGPRWFRPDGDVFIPLEFADAAYRYGHGQIRPRYQLNRSTDPVPLFPDLLGFRPVPRDRAVDWTLFFDALGSATAQGAKRIDGRLVQPLIQLPLALTGQTEIADYHSLAVRDLQRGQGVGLPSGEAVARHLGVTPLTRDEVGLAGTGWAGETPLWYYVLREAAVCMGGARLGPVGGRIVAEVIIGLLARDPTSVRSADAEWRPRRRLIDLLRPSAVASNAG